MSNPATPAADLAVSREAIERIRAAIDDDDVDFISIVATECPSIDHAHEMLIAARDTEAQCAALTQIIADMEARKARLTAKTERLRRLSLWVLQELGLRRWVWPELTASVSTGRRSLLVDEAALPSGWWRAKLTPNRTAIRVALEAGEHVPGAQLGNAAPSLTLRTR